RLRGPERNRAPCRKPGCNGEYVTEYIARVHRGLELPTGEWRLDFSANEKLCRRRALKSASRFGLPGGSCSSWRNSFIRRRVTSELRIRRASSSSRSACRGHVRRAGYGLDLGRRRAEVARLSACYGL